jgi:hypothetical protein
VAQHLSLSSEPPRRALHPSNADAEKRCLSERKELRVHAPMADFGGVAYHKDAVYVNVPGSFTRGNADGEHTVSRLQRRR